MKEKLTALLTTNKKLTAFLLTTATIATSQLAFVPQAKAGWDWWQDGVQPNLNAVRANAVGRFFDQKFVGYLDGSTLESLKAQHGGDYEAVLADWCNNAVASSNYADPWFDVPYVSSTWRIENGNVNCYSRGYK
jgi:hypothetical protein